jgi:hypothetical protein
MIELVAFRVCISSEPVENLTGRVSELLQGAFATANVASETKLKSVSMVEVVAWVGGRHIVEVRTLVYNSLAAANCVSRCRPAESRASNCVRNSKARRRGTNGGERLERAGAGIIPCYAELCFTRTRDVTRTSYQHWLLETPEWAQWGSYRSDPCANIEPLTINVMAEMFPCHVTCLTAMADVK